MTRLPKAQVAKAGQRSVERYRVLRHYAMALLAAVIVSTLFVPADSTSVARGETLPQVLAILLVALLATASGIPLWLGGARHRMANCLMFIAIGWMLLSTLSSVGQGDGRAAWNGFWHLLSLLLIVTLTQRLVTRAAATRAVWQLLLLCSIFQATYAVHQYFISLPEARAAYLRDPDLAIEQAGIDAPPGSELRMQYESRLLGSSEPTGTFALANSLAVQLSGGLLVLMFAQLSALRRIFATGPPSASRLAYCLLWLAWLLIVVAWLLTKSRTAYLALIATVLPAMYMLWQSKRSLMPTRASKSESSLSTMRHDNGKDDLSTNALETSHDNASPVGTSPVRVGSRRGWMLALTTILVSGIMVGGVIALLASDQLVVSEAPKSIAFRLEYWQASARMILDYPWTGVGLGNFQSFYPRYKVPTASEIVADPHNWIFDVGASLSLVVLLLALVAIGRLVQAWWKVLQVESTTTGREPAELGEETLAGWVWIGAGAGFLLITLLQIALQEMVDLWATTLGLLVCLPALWALRTWSAPVGIMRLTAMAAAIVMLMTLLASGSWQASGIAIPWCIWVAISLSGNTTHWLEQTSVNTRANPLNLTPANYSLLVVVGMLASFYLQAWRPVQTSWSKEQVATQLWRQGDILTAQHYARDAAAADRLGTTGATMLVQFIVNTANQAAATGRIAEFQSEAEKLPEALAEMLQREPAAYLSWSLAGESSLTMAAGAIQLRLASPSRWLEQAVEYYQQAVERYPSSVALQVQYALAIDCMLTSALPDQGRTGPSTLAQPLPHSAGNAQQVLRLNQAIAAALDLSRATPHLNRQLAAQQVWLPEPLAARFPPGVILRPVEGSPWAKAEPLCNFLRSAYKAQN